MFVLFWLVESKGTKYWVSRIVLMWRIKAVWLRFHQKIKILKITMLLLNANRFDQLLYSNVLNSTETLTPSQRFVRSMLYARLGDYLMISSLKVLKLITLICWVFFSLFWKSEINSQWFLIKYQSNNPQHGRWLCCLL